MNKQELALQYFPDATSATARAPPHTLDSPFATPWSKPSPERLPKPEPHLHLEAGDPDPPVPGRAIRHTLTPFRKKFFRRRT